MCVEPTTTTMLVASTALSAASAVAGVAGQMQQADQQSSYQKQLVDQRNQQIVDNANASNKAANEQYYQLDQRTMQEREAVSQKLQDIQKNRLQKTGQAMASSYGDLGVLLNDYYRQESSYKQNVMSNFDMTSLQLDQQKRSVKAQNEDRIASIQTYIPAPVAQPDYLGAGLKIGAAGVKYYGVKNNIKGFGTY